MIEDPISKILLENNILKGETLVVKSVNDTIKLVSSKMYLLKDS